MLNWQPARLADLIDIKHGFAFRGEYFSTEGPGDILMTPGNFSIGGGFQWGRRKYYNGPVPADYILAPGDLVVTMTDLSKAADTLGYSAIVPRSQYRLLHNQRVGKVVLCSRKVNLGYVHWLMRSQEYRNEILASVTGSTVKHTSPKKILAFQFMLPPLGEQEDIASTLAALDAKIELNRRMNQTLEAIARSIFKDWFVDFGPTRAKMQGRAPYLAPDIWTLFPDRLDHQKKPEGWDFVALETLLAELETGGRPKGGVAGYREGVPSVGAESIVGLGYFEFQKTKFIPRTFFEGMNKGHVKSGDVLLYKDGGKPGLFEPHATLVGNGFPFAEYAINEHVYRLRASAAFGQEMLFFSLTAEATMAEMRIKGTGVAIPGLNSTQVRSLTMLNPGEALTRAFASSAGALVNRVLANCNEGKTLAAVRDLILPKLMSGEIRIRDAEAIVADAA